MKFIEKGDNMIMEIEDDDTIETVRIARAHFQMAKVILEAFAIKNEVKT